MGLDNPSLFFNFASLIFLTYFGVDYSKSQIFDAAYYRLPRTVAPVRYKISIKPDLYNDPPTFLANATIETIALEATSNITFHARNLGINRNNLIVLDEAGHKIAQKDPAWIDEAGFYIVNLESNLERGARYTIVASNYTGRVNLDNAGLYLAKYTDREGKERRMATTQFQSVGARMVYPCFDEPAFKAAYSIEIIRPSNYSSISNQPRTAEIGIPNTDLARDVYQQTPLTASYAMAYVVSEFSHVGNDRFKIFARPEAIASGFAEHALAITADIVLSLEYYLDVPYSLPKLDQIAIPDEYFAPGAMENWGLVTYKETLLLVDEERITTREKQRVSNVIAHEIAHMWFGNLVTLLWWNFLWLNEGFATYFSYSVFNVIAPTWRMMDQFVTSALQYSLRNDCLNSTQPINFATTPPGGGPPSWVAYEKGASLLRMIESFLGPDIFQKSLTAYLENRKYSVAVSEDLYHAFQRVTNENGINHLIDNLTISAILTTWEYQPGYPVVMISRNYSDNSVKIEQSKFRIYNHSSSPNESLWYIPVNFACGDGSADFSQTYADLWLTQNQTTYDISSCGSDHWLLINKKQTGFYRVNYDEDNWNRIITHLNIRNIEEIHVLNRAQLIDDAFNLAKYGYLPYQTALNLSRFLSNEYDYVPWVSYLTVLDFLIYNMASSGLNENFKEYIFNLAENVSSNLGFEETSRDWHVAKLHRNILLRYLCSLDHPGCINASKEYFRRWHDENIEITPNLQEAYFCGSMKSANQDEWNFLFEQYLNSSQYRYNYRLRVLAGLACSNNQTILNRYLDIIVNENNIIAKTHQTAAFQNVVRSGAIGLEVVLRYIETNLAQISDRIQGTVLDTLATRLTSDSQLQRLETMANISGINIFSTPILLAKENIRWVQTNLRSIEEWLQTNVA